MEPRFDDCDLDLRHGHAGVHAGAWWDVTESAAATLLLDKAALTRSAPQSDASGTRTLWLAYESLHVHFAFIVLPSASGLRMLLNAGLLVATS